MELNPMRQYREVSRCIRAMNRQYIAMYQSHEQVMYQTHNKFEARYIAFSYKLMAGMYQHYALLWTLLAIGHIFVPDFNCTHHQRVYLLTWELAERESTGVVRRDNGVTR